ncbi:MAG: NIPSNAP family protein [Alphaproteobacteria bacterium]|nr:NIPSNAP family protein [Alphaproteobacteria bacterium]HCP01500.1 NIPSNAP family protein [Rhodospirillaceae bacterium]
MIHELRTYTTRPGAIPEILKINEEVGRKARGNNYGVLEGYWYTEIGPLNQVMHLWQYESYEERTRLRTELSQVEDWTQKYVPALRPLLVDQTTRFLNPTKDLVAPAKEGNFYEFRNYRLKPGTAMGWMKRFIDVMPTREKYSQNVCAWITEGPNPNEVCHLWAYQSLEERMETRNGVATEKAWQEFATAGREDLEEMHSTMLFPSNFSPLK